MARHDHNYRSIGIARFFRLSFRKQNTRREEHACATNMATSVEHVNKKLGSSYIECRFSRNKNAGESRRSIRSNVMNMHTG